MIKYPFLNPFLDSLMFNPIMGIFKFLVVYVEGDFRTSFEILRLEKCKILRLSMNVIGWDTATNEKKMRLL